MQDFNITAIPLNPFDVILLNRWQLCSYQAFAQVMRMGAEEIEQQISPRAFSFYSFSNETFFIIYNSNQLPEKITYSLAHEIGHILHGHISKATPFLTEEESERLLQDTQADQFARFALQLPG